MKKREETFNKGRRAKFGSSVLKFKTNLINLRVISKGPSSREGSGGGRR